MFLPTHLAGGKVSLESFNLIFSFDFFFNFNKKKCDNPHNEATGQDLWKQDSTNPRFKKKDRVCTHIRHGAGL